MNQQEQGNWKPENVKAILNNIELVLKTKDSAKLNGTAYTFIMNISGFIAHYDLHGFRANYEDLRGLINKLDPDFLRSDAFRDETDSDFRQWHGEAYNKSNADIKRGLADLSEKYKDEVNTHFEEDGRRQAVEEVNRTVHNYGISINEILFS